MVGNDLSRGIPFGLRQNWLYVNDPRKTAERLRRQYGDTVRVAAGNQAEFITMSPAGAQEVLSADPSVFDAFAKEGFRGVAGRRSLWVLGGEQHRSERKLLSPSFHARRFRNLGREIQEVTFRHINEWQVGQNFRALDTTLRISLDVILRLAFGAREGDAIVEGREVIERLFRTIHPIFTFFPKLQSRWFPPWNRYQKSKKAFTAYVDRRLAERRRTVLSREADDLMGRMMTARYKDGSSMSDEAIRDELITILLAGHVTTATALSWALYELSRHPSSLERLRSELAALGPDPEPDLIVRQPYLSAVCDETLRLRTLLPEIARVTTTPVELFGQTIAANTGIVVSIITIHHDPDLYPEPDRFKPERFLERTYSPFEFLPFGGSHRRCLGARLSDFEMRIALATIAMNWELEPVGEEIEIRHDIAMGPKHWVRMRVKARYP